VRKLTLWEIDLPDVIEATRYTRSDFYGYDPGTVNIGLAWTRSRSVMVAKLEMERIKNPVERMKEISRVMSEIEVSMPQTHGFGVHVIEGASFLDKFRQVELAEARATILWWIEAYEMGVTHIVPPVSIRKRVFGDVKIKATDFWESDLPTDALAALSCLYRAMQLAVEAERMKLRRLELGTEDENVEK